VSRWLTCGAADGEAMERAQAFAGAHVQRAALYDSPQLSAFRHVDEGRVRVYS
jgi:hypothetical protein